MKPHVIFYDEEYSSYYFKQSSSKPIVEDDKIDCLLVLGTGLPTKETRQLVFKTLNRQEVPVIEVNPQP